MCVCVCLFVCVVVVLCATADTVRKIMLEAAKLHFDNGEYVFINIDLFSTFVFLFSTLLSLSCHHVLHLLASRVKRWHTNIILLASIVLSIVQYDILRLATKYELMYLKCSITSVKIAVRCSFVSHIITFRSSLLFF